MNYKCTFLAEINECPYFKLPNNCINTSIVNCGFRMENEENKNLKNPYIRQKRWYENLPSRQKKSGNQRVQ